MVKAPESSGPVCACMSDPIPDFVEQLGLRAIHVHVLSFPGDPDGPPYSRAMDLLRKAFSLGTIKTERHRQSGA